MQALDNHVLPVIVAFMLSRVLWSSAHDNRQTLAVRALVAGVSSLGLTTAAAGTLAAVCVERWLLGED